MDNRITKGSEGIPRSDIQQSYIPYPVNEDYSMVVEVLACTNNIITCQKVWDIKGEKKFFHAYKIKGEVVIGGYIVIHRVGEFNSQGNTDPELRVQQVSNFSWIYLGFVPDVFIKDVGNNTGVVVEYNADKTHTQITVNPKPLHTLDPDTCYHNGNPPFKEGRIYFGQQADNGYLVWLPGFGEVERTLIATVDGTPVNMDVDGQGNVLNVYADEVQYDFYMKNVYRWFKEEFEETNYGGSYIYPKRYRYDFFLDEAGEDVWELPDVDYKEVLAYHNDYGTQAIVMKSNHDNAKRYTYYTTHKMMRKMQRRDVENGVSIDMFWDPLITWIVRPVDLATYPGAGVYPPAGCYNWGDEFVFRVKEVYVDGSSRITQKDETQKRTYGIQYNDATFAYEPFLSREVTYMGSSFSLHGCEDWRNVEEYFIPNIGNFMGYVYESQPGGATPYSLVSSQAGIWSKGITHGKVTFPTSGWGTSPIISNCSIMIILVVNHGGAEVWFPQRELDKNLIT